MGAHSALCPHCARPVHGLCQKSAMLGSIPPMVKVTALTTAFPYVGPLRFLLSPKTQINPRFTLKMPDCCLNLLVLPRGRTLPPAAGGLQGGHGKPNLPMGDMPSLRARPHDTPR